MTSAISDVFGVSLNDCGPLRGLGKTCLSMQDQKVGDLFKKMGAGKTFMSGCMREYGINEIVIKGSYEDRAGNIYSAEVKIAGEKENSENRAESNKEIARDFDDRADSRDHDYE